MIINTAPQDKAVLSNVAQIGEFRIRNSAKAFNILSSGLYGNKIRAIVRELSCNAVDSHMAAGCADTPFDVHLPNQLEPWFAIRDYGTGLDHEQVTNIYTTYFESTKTDSNDYIGALGLGSKSPFSYTDNFTVIAVKNGRRGIYTAFINDLGIPSIALMTEEETTEPNGVEVKFAVNSHYDFDKFRQEAVQVYQHFALRPVVSGNQHFKFEDIAYESKDIVPGVHQTKNGRGSTAVMGNIAYPIEIPNPEQTLGDLRYMLNYGLEFHFAIGELDFQASREGLSYIPQTVEAIKAKLSALNSVLVTKLKAEADAIDNLWERAFFLSGKKHNTLWSAAVSAYGTIPTFDHKAYGGSMRLTARVDAVSKKYNISISGFTKVRDVMTMTPTKTVTNHGPVKDDGTRDVWQEYQFAVCADDHFVINDIKRGVKARAKHHYRNNKDVHNRNVYILEAVDKTKPMLIKQFFASIYEPPQGQRFVASQLSEKPRESNGSAKASVLKLVETRRGRWNTQMVWNHAGTVDDYDQSKTYYYVQMEGWVPVGIPCGDIKEFHEWVSKSGLCTDSIYGVRKGDMAVVNKLTNWVELGSYVRNKLQVTNLNNVMGLVKEAIDFKGTFKYINSSLNQNTDYYKLYEEFKDVTAIDSNKRYYIERLLKVYGITVSNVTPDSIIQQYRTRVENIYKRYPLLRHLSYSADVAAVVSYINMVEQHNATGSN